MHDQLSLPVDRKLQNSLILSMKSSIEERIRQAAIVILQLLYTHFQRDHHKQQTQRRRASTTTLEAHTPLSRKSSIESNGNTEKNSKGDNNSTIKVSALVAHYSSSESSAAATNNVCTSRWESLIRYAEETHTSEFVLGNQREYFISDSGAWSRFLTKFWVGRSCRIYFHSLVILIKQGWDFSSGEWCGAND